MAGEVDPEVFTEIITSFGEPVTFANDSYYNDEAAGLSTFAMWKAASTDYKTGAPEATSVLKVPATGHTFTFAAGQSLTSAQGLRYEVVKVEPKFIIDSRVQHWIVGVKR